MKMALDNIREDMKEYNMTEVMAETRNVWHMTLKVGPLLHGGLSMRRLEDHSKVLVTVTKYHHG